MLTVHLVKEHTVPEIKHKATEEKESSEKRRFIQEFEKCLNLKN
jgi:hypothetical protein